MQTRQVLHTIIKKSSPNMHRSRLNALLEVSSGLLNNAKLSLSSIGRHLKGKSTVKSKIKKADRLLGNGQLYSERLDIYKTMARCVIGGKSAITVLVDWSPAAENKNQILKASLAMKHRSITLYEEVHPLKDLGKHCIHQSFLQSLKKVLPQEVQVLIVTDAGFRTDWFALVQGHGWDFEGRIRTQMKYTLNEGENWFNCKELYERASHKAKYIGSVLLTKSSRLPCEMYLYKGLSKKKKRPKRKHENGTMVEIYRKSFKDPWLLVTSIGNHKRKASWVVQQYKLRMKIEHEFRDTKDAKWGIGLRYSKTSEAKRLEILLLIAAIALLQLWMIGLYAEKNNWQYAYQANTIKTHRVLSLIFLGLQIITHEPEKIRGKNLISLLKKEDLNSD